MRTSRLAASIALILLAWLSACAPTAGVVAFNLDHHWIEQPVLRLDEGTRLEGLGGFVLSDVTAPGPALVAPVEAWSDRVAPADLPVRLQRVEIYGLDGPAALLGTASQVYGTVGAGPQGDDFSQDVVLFLLDGVLDRAVHALELESRPPAVGDVYYVVGCRAQQQPCEQDTHPVEITEVRAGQLRGQPQDYVTFHAVAGCPLVTPAGRVVGMLARRAGADSPDLIFVPAAAIRARLDTASSR